VGVVSLNCEPLDWAARESGSCETWQGPAIDLTRRLNWLGNDRDRSPGSLSFTSKTGKRSRRNTASATKKHLGPKKRSYGERPLRSERTPSNHVKDTLSSPTYRPILAMFRSHSAQSKSLLRQSNPEQRLSIKPLLKGIGAVKEGTNLQRMVTKGCTAFG
jgi:hypothetical protein